MGERIKVKVSDMDAVIQHELMMYHQEVNKQVDAVSQKAVKKLAKKTRATAPEGTGKYKKAIATKLLRSTPNGNTYVWYVRAPHYRLTHLLAKGHATKNGGRTRADPFLQNAIDEVIPEYERDIKEVLSNGK